VLRARRPYSVSSAVRSAGWGGFRERFEEERRRDLAIAGDQREHRVPLYRVFLNDSRHEIKGGTNEGRKEG